MVTDEDMTAEEEEAATPAEAGRRRAGAGATLDKRGLLKRVVATSGIPAPQARKLLDAALAEIATALDSGAALSLPPLGKLRPVRTADQAGKSIHTLRLRRSPAGSPGEAAAEEGAENKPGARARARAKAGAAARRGGAQPAPASTAAGDDQGDA